ncbi:hypothetical protein [Rhizobium oryzicola]|uniref:Uncharacterized protein n=1 Tax=Rhizobium oryzicola TaxID=1232668 RepID=A0ABT8SYI1_9HYPH|nr:hypothetical protein [Rhizobium oryzicola]MDO1582697.1 hypothetical protein [Rhizobium oryzicola]
MSGAFLALWNDYPATLTDEYEAWHTYEHVPERLTTPGMLWARRYADFAQPDNRYFTLYALETLQVLDQPSYLDLVRRPTDWSLSMRRHFLNVLRIPASDFASGGCGLGGSLIAQVYAVGRKDAASRSKALAAALEQMASSGRILGYSIGLAEPNQRYEVFEQTDITDPNCLNVVVMVEGTTRAGLEMVYDAVSDAATTALKPQSCLRDGIFTLLVTYDAAKFSPNRELLTASPALRSRF